MLEQIEELPEKPGVYFFMGDSKELVYIGKSINLRKRVRSYFQRSSKTFVKKPTRESFKKLFRRFHWQITEKQYKNWYTLRINKIRKKKIEITRKSKEIRYILTSDEEEAYSLEGFLISAFHPPLNHTIGKYKFIEITLNEEIPRLLISTGKYSEDSYLYGPFEHSTNLEVAIDGFLQFFRLCNSPKPCERISPQHIPCLRYHMHRCLGPCKDNNSNIKKEYQKELQAFINSLKNNGKQVVDYLTQMMNKKIKVNDFKVAALYRDRINAIKIMFEKKCFPYLIRKYYSQLKKVLGATPYFKIIYDIYTENNMKSNRTFFQ